MEKMVKFINESYSNKKVLITGHTGFKGSWLTQLLLNFHAELTGYSIDIPTTPSLFQTLDLEKSISHNIADILDQNHLKSVIHEIQPDYIFHLAAQPLVRESFKTPDKTFQTNAIGTLNLLEILRHYDKPCSVVIVTTDKCYENKEWLHSYRENDSLGGHDPYSASKACSEIITTAYRKSFFQKSNIRIASARAGNVIGGGDWSKDRLIPDCIQNLNAQKLIPVRNKHSTRPWQHVLEPLFGYLTLGAKLQSEPALDFFNFGPPLNSNKSVEELVLEVFKHWPGDWDDQSDPKAPHEASFLNLSTDKAYHQLSWHPIWDFATSIEKSVQWYFHFYQNQGNEEAHKRMQALTQMQISQYLEDCISYQ